MIFLDSKKNWLLFVCLFSGNPSSSSCHYLSHCYILFARLSPLQKKSSFLKDTLHLLHLMLTISQWNSYYLIFDFIKLQYCINIVNRWKIQSTNHKENVLTNELSWLFSGTKTFLIMYELYIDYIIVIN